LFQLKWRSIEVQQATNVVMSCVVPLSSLETKFSICFSTVYMFLSFLFFLFFLTFFFISLDLTLFSLRGGGRRNKDYAPGWFQTFLTAFKQHSSYRRQTLWLFLKFIRKHFRVLTMVAWFGVSKATMFSKGVVPKFTIFWSLNICFSEILEFAEV